MKLKRFSKYIAGPSRVFITIVILMFMIVLLQSIVAQMVQNKLYQTYLAKTPQDVTKGLSEQEKKARRIERSAKNFLPDGTVHLVYLPQQPYYQRDESMEFEIYDTNDNLLWRGIKKDVPYEYLSLSARAWNAFSENSIKESQIITAEFSHSLIIPVGSTEGVIRQVWRYEPKLQYFKGYKVRGTEIGYIGAAGFSDKKSEVKPLGKLVLFSAWTPKTSLEPRCIWQTDRRIYEIDFGDRTVELLFESPQAKILSISMQNWRGLESEITEKSTIIRYRSYIHCRTEDQNHHLIMCNPSQTLTIKVPEEWISSSTSMAATEQNVYVHRTKIEGRPRDTGDKRLYRRLMRRWLAETRNKPIKFRVELYKAKNEGGLELVNSFNWIRLAHERFKVPDYMTKSARYVSCVSPNLYDVVWVLYKEKLWLISNRFSTEFAREYARIVENFRPKNSLFHWVLNILMIAFTIWHGWSRRTGWGRFVFWIVFVGLFNLAGLLTYLALNHTVIIKCPVCGRRRGLKRTDCIRCGSELPAPKARKLDLILST